jgi:ubiquinone/menaquinone biosynthesis C-methylase UbiE
MDAYLDLDPAAYDRGIGRWTRRLAERFFDYVGLGEDERVVDLGCGTGSLGKVILRRLTEVELHCCDPSASSIALLHSQVHDSRLHLHVADGNRLPLPGRYFDRSFSMLALTFAGPGALGEKARVTRPGGWIAAGVADFRDTRVMIRRLYDLCAGLSPQAAQLRHAILGAPMSSSMRAAAESRRLGLQDVQVTPLAVSVDYDSFDDCWSVLAARQGPNGAIVACLPATAREEVRQALRQAYLAGEPDGPRQETIAIWALKARLPA